MQRRILGVSLLGLVLVVGVIMIARQRPAVQPSTKPLVITTLFPYYDAARIIAGPYMDVESLFPFGVGVHDGALTPDSRERLASANLIITNGLGLEPFAKELPDIVSKKTTILEASRGIHILAGDPQDQSGNPHIWMSPANMMTIAATIRDGLIAVDPAHRGAYEKNTADFVEQLRSLDDAFQKDSASAPSKSIVTFHDAFVYLADRYQLAIAGVLEEFPGREPSARELADLIATIKRVGVKAIFSEPQFSPRIVETVASDLHLKVFVLDPMETAVDGDAYLKVMERNRQALNEALRQ